MSNAEASMRHFLRGYEDKFPRQLSARFPHLLQGIVERWNNTEAMEAYFSELMIPNRPNRQGFPEEIAREILALSVAYDTIRRINLEEPSELWEPERARDELERLRIDRTTANFARAAEAGNHALCLLFISSGFDVNMRDSRHWTPLMMAAFNGREVLAYKLIQHGADVHAQDNRGYTPMHWAAFNGYPSVIELLISKRGDVNARSTAGITPLLQAAARGHVEACAELLNGGALPNIAADNGATPLLKAVANGCLPVINLLLSVDAKLDAQLENGKSLLEIAMDSKDPEIRQRIADAAKAAEKDQ